MQNIIFKSLAVLFAALASLNIGIPALTDGLITQNIWYSALGQGVASVLFFYASTKKFF